jgi:hypothetical protein
VNAKVFVPALPSVRLTSSIVGVLAAALLALSIVLHALFARALVQQFDGRLLGDAAAVAGMAEDDASQSEFEYESLPEFERAGHPAYFEAWLDDADAIARRRSGRREPRAPRPRGPAEDRRRRAAGRARGPSSSGGPCASRTPRAPRTCPAHVDRSSTSSSRAARSWPRRWRPCAAGWWGWRAGALGASGAALLAVSRGLRPTRALGNQIARLDAAHLTGALKVDELPEELAPLVSKMNELLAACAIRSRWPCGRRSHGLRRPWRRCGQRWALSRARNARYRDALRSRAVVRQMGLRALSPPSGRGPTGNRAAGGRSAHG